MDRDITSGRQSDGNSGGPSGFPAEASPPISIPDHQLLQCIGRGSYGEVWLARNPMGTYRAVKIVFRKAFENDRPFQRELSGIRKFEPISRSHEGFIDVLHVGINEAEGYFYYVMELGDDQNSGQNIDPANYFPLTLGKEISIHGRLPFQECLQLGLALSLALEELHKRGLVHRDVKPSNIIFVNGVPKLADIGLVADVDEARSYVGTEGFIPPEGPGAPQADVYSLGKVLYEASTGKDRQVFPELPTRLDTSADEGGFWELNEVILQACKNDLAKRYRSAWDMHADLLVLANGKSVKRLKILEQRLANLKRIAGVTALVLLVLAIVFYQVYREWQTAEDARERQVGASVAYGNRAMEAGNLLEALPYFAEALRLDRPKNDLTHRLRLGSILAQCPKLTRMWDLQTELADCQFSPDGKKVVVADYSSIGRATLLDVEPGSPCDRVFGLPEGTAAIAYSHDGRFVSTCSANTVHVWDSVNLQEVSSFLHPEYVMSAKFSADGNRIVTGCNDGIARVWNMQTHQVELSLKHDRGVMFAEFSPADGRYIVTASRDSTARLWDSHDGHPIGPPLVHKNWVTFASFSPDGSKLVTASMDHTASVWEVPGGRRIMPNLDHRDGVRSAEFSPDGQLILTASFDGTMRLWRADDLLPVASNPVLKGSDRVYRATFDSDGRRIVSVCVDGTVRIWDLAGSVMPSIPASLSCSPDGSRLISSTNDHIEIWNAATGKSAGPAIIPRLPLWRVESNRTGSTVASVSLAFPHPGGTNFLIQVWEAASGKNLGPEICISNDFMRLSFSEDGKRLVTAGQTNAQAWEVGSGIPLFPTMFCNDTIRQMCFSPDGNRIAVANGIHVQVCEATTGRLLFKPLEQDTDVVCVEFSRDGSRLLTSCSDGTLGRCAAQVWDATTGRPIGRPLNHSDGVLFASFSPDGRRVVTASEDFTSIIWDATTGKQLAPTLNHDHQLRTACFSPDGRCVLTSSLDQTARIWNAETGDPLTPPLRHLTPLAGARFLADGRHVITTDRSNGTTLWDLPVDQRPVEDLQKLTQLLSSGGAVSSGRLSSTATNSLQNLWESLRTTYPASFTVSTPEIAAWHEFQARACEMDQQWFAAEFHLQRLHTLQPGDPSVSKRLAQAREKMRN